ncbi:DUF4259 domain-containing protein [Rhizohabitans arisaemae]|uniref:DUF4259 domain-containing protein n=1 Tax=Rhizohabitans arisaemae TaxID=2720610 RepID=UPI0024B1E65A|nr:DUF4259 domain-containing protein [Rhizohabitans arisaemae]
MGAWGYGPFDNDGALDGLGNLNGSTDLERDMSAVMEAALKDDYVEGPEMSEAIAVACLIAAQYLPAEENPNAAKWLADNPFEVTDDLRDLAHSTFERALDPQDNELYDLWEEGGSLDEWRAELAPYRQAIA